MPLSPSREAEIRYAIAHCQLGNATSIGTTVAVDLLAALDAERALTTKLREELALLSVNHRP